MVCSVPRLGCTLYPPGHVPYGRVAVAPVSPTGEPVFEHQGEKRLGAAWALTIFCGPGVELAKDEPVG